MSNSRIAATLALIIAILSSGPPPASAATLEKGTIELTPSLGFSRNSFSFSGSDVGSITVLSASGLLGYSVTDHVQLGGGLLVNHQAFSSPGSTSDSETSLGVIAGLQYNFSGGGQTIPFVRGAVGVATHSGNLSVGDKTTVIAPALSAGLRVLVGSSASVNFGVGYQHESGALGLQDLGANTFTIEIGLSIFTRRGR